MYGLPLPPSNVERLAAISTALGADGLSLLVDHPGQLSSVCRIQELSGHPPHVYIKIDMGGHRAGVAPQGSAISDLIAVVVELERSGSVLLQGFYSHAGHSYAGNDRATALDFLRQEFEALLVATNAAHAFIPEKKLTLSVGATPTTTSVRNLLLSEAEQGAMTTGEREAVSALSATIAAIRAAGCSVEVHAGVYPVLDVQQLATHALPQEGPKASLSWDDLAFTIVAEVASLYPGRGKDGRPEALIGAGSISLGREPCKAYPGFGIVSPWNIAGATQPQVGPEAQQGWQVGRISQEHGILAWNGEVGTEQHLAIGQKVKIWPNHACIAGAGFGWYLIVDSSSAGKEDDIIDVWPRWRGW